MLICGGHWMLLYSFIACLSLLLELATCLDSLMAMPCPSEAKLGNTHAEKLIYQFVSFSFLKLDLNVLLYLFIHSTLPGYFLFRWRRTALSLDSVLALQISWHLSSRSTSLRVDWKSESDSCHLLPMRCFFSMFSRESSILYGQQINIITFYLHTWSENSNRQITAYVLCFTLHVRLTSPRSIRYKKCSTKIQ